MSLPAWQVCRESGVRALLPKARLDSSSAPGWDEAYR